MNYSFDVCFILGLFAKKRVGGKTTEGEIKDVKYCSKLN
jgi:hypothetical protein